MKRNAVIVVVLVALLALGIGWWRQGAADRELANATQEFSDRLDEQMEAAVDSEGGDGLPITNSFHVEGMDSMEALDEDQLEEFSDEIVPTLMQKMYDGYSRILEMPPQEQRKQLDRIIDQQMASKDKVEDLIGDAAGSEPGMTRRVRMRRSPGPDGGESEEVTRMIDSRTEDGERFLVDNTTPEQRAIMAEYVDLLRSRMKERGIDPEDVPITVSLSIESERPAP